MVLEKTGLWKNIETKSWIRSIKKTCKMTLAGFYLFSLFFSLFAKDYTLNLKCITSPSFTIYSFPSTLNLPASFAFASEP